MIDNIFTGVKMRTLIVEDNPGDVELIKINLQKSKLNGMQYDTAATLEETKSKIKEEKYSAIVLDLGLPDSKGIDTVSMLIDFLQEENKTCPIIVLTGLKDYSVGKKALEIGAQDFIVKDDLTSKSLGRSLYFFTCPASI